MESEERKGSAQSPETAIRSLLTKLKEPCVLVIFGANGDLTRRMLMPALFYLEQEGCLPDQFAIVGCSRTSFSQEEFQDQMLKAVQASGPWDSKQREAWKNFSNRIFYLRKKFWRKHLMV